MKDSKKDKPKKTPSKPKPSDLGTGAAARAAGALGARNRRSQDAMDEAQRILLGLPPATQRTDEWQ